MTTAFVDHPLFAQHEVPRGHPESPLRLAAILAGLRRDGLLDRLAPFEAVAATREQLERVHAPALLDALAEAAPADGLVGIDPDTFLGPRSLLAAYRAAGACVLATDLVLAGRVDNAFCCVRPPGHHAGRATPMGFCLFNNVAVGAAHALEQHGLERVAIVDFDVHQGNGTEDIFAGDERVLICSSYQHPFYPHTGGRARGPNIVDVPLPAGTAGAAFRDAVVGRWQPACERFEPQCVFVSAGFDAHADDPLGGMLLTEADFRWVTEWVIAVAGDSAGGRIVSTLEGGYHPAALGRSVAAHVGALAG